MSGLQDFFAPFSHLLFANRDKAIIALGIALGWFTIQLLIARWRNERLQRDLAAAKAAPASSSSRRYSPTPQVDEAPAESGGLPPVKGGRSYARNLGTALSKAGIPSQPIYSPPSPQGWGPNPGQPGMGQPQQGAPYAPPNAPWGAPNPPQQSPWGYPAAGRPTPPQAPSPGPFYQPAPQQPAPPAIATPPSGPGFFAPPSPPAFSHPAFAPPTSGAPAPLAPPPLMAQPPVPMGPPMAPAFGNPPPSSSPVPAAPEADRRGKPKRRRFNFNVLENLEKMVQARSEPLPPTGWTPPAVAPPTAAAPVPAPIVPPVVAIPELKVVPPPAPALESVSPVNEPAAEAPSLPLPFGPAVEDAPEAAEPEGAATDTEEANPAEQEEEPTVSSEAEEPIAAVEPEAPVAEAEVEAEPELEPTAPPAAQPRASMRDMLFGEEAPAAAAAEPAPTPAPAEAEPASAEWSWRPTRWEPAEETTPAPIKEIGPIEPVVEEAAVVEDGPEPAPATDAPVNEPEPFAPWKSSFASSVFETEPSGADVDEVPAVSYPEPPTADSGSGSGAGSVVIIEDDETAASYYATLFRGNGYRVEVANDGVSGVDLCARVQPQVILLDVMMPRQNGILVLQTLRASDETKNTPVVVMSNFSEPTLIKRAIQLGALEYVIKTQVEGSALLNAMPRWMNREKAFAAA